MTNRSVFPSAVDSFQYLSEVLSSDKANIDRYQTLLMQATRTVDEETELTNLKTTLYNAGKVLSSESLNKIFDCMTNLEDYFLNRVMVDLAALDVGVLQADIDNHISNTSDPHQSYAQAVLWAKGFGLGDVAKDIGNTNLNNLNATGFYKGGNITNAPDNDTWFIIHMESTTYKTQMAYKYTNNDIYKRALVNGTWNSWQQIAIADQESWINLTLQNSWLNYGASYGKARYRTNNNGEVEIKGSIKSGTTTVGTTIATLPSGYRPPSDMTFVVVSSTGASDVLSRVTIRTNGIIEYQSGSNVMFSLDSIPPIPTV
jgi:hypothetical protein